MRGFIDLHCHFLARIDDGARSESEGLEMLRALHAVGFDRVVATPHIGAHTRESIERVGLLAVRNVVNVLEGKEPLHRVV